MAWLKLDDNTYRNPKILELSTPAFRIHIGALLHCAQNLTDGEVTMAALLGLMVPDIRKKPKNIASELVAAGLWAETADGVWAIADYLEYNPARADVVAKREADRKRKAGIPR